MLLRQEADHNQWLIIWMVNVYSNIKGNVSSVRLLLGASYKLGNSAQYSERINLFC